MPSKQQIFAFRQHFHILKRVQDGRATYTGLTKQSAGEILKDMLWKAEDAELETIADQLANIAVNNGTESDFDKAHAEQLKGLKLQRAQLQAARPSKAAKAAN